MRWWEWLLLTLGVLMGVLMIVGAIGSYIDGSAACERKGGAYFCPRGSSCICLAPGVVLP
ncbi:MAG TPA: hypothetical protein VER04_24350 [Polyangiaceae bacterium]|nr:hypothetical protein [Polyangiaceae bacterium]